MDGTFQYLRDTNGNNAICLRFVLNAFFGVKERQKDWFWFCCSTLYRVRCSVYGTELECRQGQMFFSVSSAIISLACEVRCTFCKMCSAVWPDIGLQTRRIRWVGHVARMGERWTVCRVLVGKREGKEY